jgi:integrase
VPRIKLTKSAIDSLSSRAVDVVYWDTGCPGFGVKVTPKGRKVFLVLYRTGRAARSCENIRLALMGKSCSTKPASHRRRSSQRSSKDEIRLVKKREARIREVTDRVADVLESYITQHVSANRSAADISRLLRREVGQAWGNKSVHDITKRDVVGLVSAIEERGAPAAANKTLKSIKTFLGWCVGRAILDKSPADGVPLPAREETRDRILSDIELAKVIRFARMMAVPYGDILEFLALTGQRREEVTQATWDESTTNLLIPYD